jgi:transcriptional regulator with XRE-family HTH domain
MRRMKTADVVRIARQRAGLTQQQLADRSGHPRETIARWETGAREPSLTDLRALVSAADLDLVINLAQRDESLLEAVDDELQLTPMQRLRRALPDGEWKDARRGLRWLSRAPTPTIVIGGIGGVLHGAPQRPHSGRVEFVSADPFATEHQMRAEYLVPIDSEERWLDVDARALWTLPKGGTLALASNVPGTDDYRDLRRSAVPVQLDKTTAITVAHPRDLLRMADASPREPERARIPGLRALLDRTRDE